MPAKTNVAEPNPVTALAVIPPPALPEATAQDSLVRKLARIADQIGDKEAQEHRGRDGERSGVKFPYHAAKDVYGWWRPLLQREGLLLIPTGITDLQVLQATLPAARGGNRVTFLTTGVVHFQIRDGITGEYIDGASLAQGEDPSDKGAGKLMTYAEKNFLLGFGMNGSEPDVEAYDNDRDAREGAAQASSREDRRLEVEITDSNITGIERGGRSSNATEAQVSAVKAKALQLGIGGAGLIEYIYLALEKTVPMPPDPADRGPALVSFLSGLTADDIGKLLVALDKPRQIESGPFEGDEQRPEDQGDGYPG